MKRLKITCSILLGMICLFASVIFFHNNDTTNKLSTQYVSVEQLCETDNNTTFIQSGSTKSQVLKSLGIIDSSVYAHSASAETSLDDGEIVSLCSENNMVAIETDDGFEVYGKFQLKQLIVNGNIDNFYGAEKVAVCFGDVYILEYKTEDATEYAYNKLKESNAKVSISQIVKTNANASTSYNSWGAEETNIDSFQTYLNTNGSNEEIVVAVLDTGINTAHEMFENRLLTNSYGQVVGAAYYNSKYTYSGYNFEDDNVEKGTPKGHGTHVSGIIADLTPSNVKILPIKVMDNKGSGSSTNIIAGLEKIYDDYANQYNVVCANLSLGGSCDTFGEANELNELFDDIFTKLRTKGVLAVVAAGNEAADTKYTWPSGCHDTAIVVSALKESYSGLVFDSSYSNYGESVDISAPGTGIQSASIGGISYWADDDAYLTMSGTSMAAPHVAAMVALINLDLNFMRSNPTASEIEDRLLSMTEDLGEEGFDVQYGYGALCYKSDAIEDIPNFETDDYIVENKSVYYDGNYHNISVTVRNVQNYKIYYGLSEYSCYLESVEGLPQFKNNTNGDVRVYFRISIVGMEDIIDFGILNIKPQPIKIKIDNKEISYGSNVDLGDGYSFVSGVVNPTDDLQISLKCVAKETSDVGEYFISAICGNSNYKLTYERGVLKIIPRVITIQLKNQNNYTASDLEVDQDQYEIIEGEIVNDDDFNLIIYPEGYKFSFKKEFKLTAYSDNANYEVNVIDAKLKIKFSYLEMVTVIASVVVSIFVISAIVNKKKNNFKI